VLWATILASAMAFIDGSVVTIALPALQADLGATFESLQWILNVYALFLGGLILVGGGAGDRFGRRRIFMIGIVVFGLASVGCAVSTSVETLIVARSIQGVGAALLVPQSLAIIATAFPRDVRGRAIGFWAGASAITTALGPPLGGVLIDWIGWRSVFWINLPLALGALWLSAAHVPESRDETAAGPLDWRGALLAIVGLGALTAGLTLLVEPERSAAGAVILLGLGLLGLTVLVRVETFASNPLVPLSLFASRSFTGANLVTLLLYGALSAVLFLLPFDLIERRGLSAAQVGLSLLPLGLIIGTGSGFAGRWADRIGPRRPLMIGSVLMAVAAAGFATGSESFGFGVLMPMLVLSLGMAIVVTPLTTAVMNSAPDAQSGASTTPRAGSRGCSQSRSSVRRPASSSITWRTRLSCRARYRTSASCRRHRIGIGPCSKPPSFARMGWPWHLRRRGLFWPA
jgi:EmrB/QacA subfamily drug resistance transporter